MWYPPHLSKSWLIRYCFRLSPEEAEMFFQLENAKGRFRFYKELLSLSMGAGEDCMISDASFEKAWQMALQRGVPQ